MIRIVRCAQLTIVTRCCPVQKVCLSVDNTHEKVQARQTRPNLGGVAEGHPRFDKGGVATIFYFLRIKNRTF